MIAPGLCSANVGLMTNICLIGGGCMAWSNVISMLGRNLVNVRLFLSSASVVGQKDQQRQVPDEVGGVEKYFIYQQCVSILNSSTPVQ